MCRSSVFTAAGALRWATTVHWESIRVRCSPNSNYASTRALGSAVDHNADLEGLKKMYDKIDKELGAKVDWRFATSFGTAVVTGLTGTSWLLQQDTKQRMKDDMNRVNERVEVMERQVAQISRDLDSLGREVAAIREGQALLVQVLITNGGQKHEAETDKAAKKKKKEKKEKRQ